jgi:hypothetical protein
MHLIRKYHEVINCFLLSCSRKAFLIAWVLVIAFLAGMAAMLIVTGAPVMNGRPGDLPILLDGAWRAANGQVPHRDFYSYLGSFPYYLICSGMSFSHPSIAAVTYATVLFMTILGPVAMLLLSRRTSPLYAALVTLFLSVLVVSPRPLGDPYDYTDYAMLYNRFGEALLGLLAPLAFLSPRRDAASRPLDVIEALVMGLLLALLLFTKLTYFFIGIALFVFAVALGFLNLRRAALCFLSTVALIALFSFVTGIPLQMMMADFRMMAAAQPWTVRVKILAIQSVKQALLLPLLLLLAWEIRAGRDQIAGRLRTSRDWLLILVLFASAVLLLSSNAQIHEMPLLVTGALYGAETIRRQSLSAPTDPFFCAVRNLVGLCFLLLFLLPILGTDLKAICHSARAVQKGLYVSTEALKTTNLGDFRFDPLGTRSLYSTATMDFLDEGIHLLERHSSPDMRLMASMFSNPFHIALALKPAKGGSVCLASSLLNQRSHPPLRRYLGDATHILTIRGQQLEREAYGAEWDALGLQIVEETTHFSLLKVRDPQAPQPNYP